MTEGFKARRAASTPYPSRKSPPPTAMTPMAVGHCFSTAPIPLTPSPMRTRSDTAQMTTSGATAPPRRPCCRRKAFCDPMATMSERPVPNPATSRANTLLTVCPSHWITPAKDSYVTLAIMMSDLPLDQVKTLLAVVDEQSFDSAAAVLHVTPSAVSQRIKSLEQRTGRVLLLRTKPVSLTSSGQVLVRFARSLAQLEQDALTELGLGSS